MLGEGGRKQAGQHFFHPGAELDVEQLSPGTGLSHAARPTRIHHTLGQTGQDLVQLVCQIFTLGMHPVVTGATLHHLTVIVIVLIALEADWTVVAQVIEFGTIWTEPFVMVPFQLPALPWCDAATFTPNARCADPGFPLLVLFGIAGSKAGGMITVLASFALQQWLGVFAFSAAHATKLAAAAAPVLLVLVGRSLRRLKTKRMERLTAHLAKQHLMLTFTGTKVANVGWHERGRGQYA